MSALIDARPTRLEWALGLAALTASRSTCLRREVGCVLLSARGHVLATGYNGVAAGQPHCNGIASDTAKDDWRRTDGLVIRPHACMGAHSPSGTNLDACQAIHAEQNALLQCRDAWAIEACCVTASPCVTCCKLLLNTSCRTIAFLDEYPQPAARELWLGAGGGREWLHVPSLPWRIED